MSFDRIAGENYRAMKNPTVVGLDCQARVCAGAHPQGRPMSSIGETLEGAADAIFQFNKGLIDALCDIVPAVKPQSAYYERLGWPGMEMLEQHHPLRPREGHVRHRRHQAGGHRLHGGGLRRRLAGGHQGEGRPSAGASTPTASPSTATWARTASTPS